LTGIIFKNHFFFQDDQAGQSPSSSNGDCTNDDSSLNASSLRRKLFTQISTPSTGDTDISVSF